MAIWACIQTKYVSFANNAHSTHLPSTSKTSYDSPFRFGLFVSMRKEINIHIEGKERQYYGNDMKVINVTMSHAVHSQTTKTSIEIQRWRDGSAFESYIKLSIPVSLPIGSQYFIDWKYWQMKCFKDKQASWKRKTFSLHISLEFQP